MENVEPFYLHFEKPWYSEEETVANLLFKLDMGEAIPVKKLADTCAKEGKQFKITVDETD